MMRPISPTSLFLPFLDKASLEKSPQDDDSLRVRIFLSASAMLGIVLLTVFGVVDFRQGSVLMPVLFIIAIPLMGWNIWAANQPRLNLLATRLTLAFSCFIIFAAVFAQDSDSNLPWLFLIPLVAVFIFGRIEGLIWSFGNLFVLCAILMNRNALNLEGLDAVGLDLPVAYAVVALFAAGYETLRQTVLTQLRDNNRTLSSEQQRFRDFAEVASDWMFEMDENLHFSYVSERWAESMQLSAEQLIGSPVTALRASLEDADESAISDFGRTLMEHEPFRDFRCAVRAPSGTFHISCSGKPMFDEEGTFTGYRGIAKNITEFEESQAVIQSKDAALVQSQKMEAIGQLTSGVAHDFNNLLTVINGNLELLKIALDKKHIDTTRIDAATSAANRAAELTAKLLAFARRQPLQPETVNLVALLHNMLELLNRTLGEQIAIELDVASDLWLCRIDPGQLENAILNLAINARDAMPDGGRLTIFCGNETITDHDTLMTGDYVLLKVADSGTGMSQQELNHAFEPFYSTKPQGQGSGLGLSMVYGFASQSGGTVVIESTPGAGTLVGVYLPRDTAASSVDQRRPVLREGAPIGTRKVLVVEDEGDVRELVCGMLEAQGHELRSAVNGTEATEILSHWQPDLLVTDVVLSGGMTGIRLAETAIEKIPSLKVLLISGYPEYALKGDGSVSTDWMLLKKPFGSRALQSAIETVYQSDT